MTKILIEKETVKLALEGLYEERDRSWKPTHKGAVAINAIKKALMSVADGAQQCVCGEPNSAGTHRTDGPCLAPQPEQEPVAYTTGHCENHKQKGGCQLHNLQCGWPDCDRKPITTPPQRTWVGLTNDDWDEIFGNALTIGEAIKVTEAKLKAKNFA